MNTVLVVEDEREIRDLLRRYLERAGQAVLIGVSSSGRPSSLAPTRSTTSAWPRSRWSR